MTTRDRTPSPPPPAPGACMRLSMEPEEPLMPPVTTTGHWSPPTPVLSTVRARLRSGRDVGRGYGILQCAAERDPSPPTSRSRPPLSSTDSDDDLSDVTVIDIGLETNAAVIRLDCYSDISEPGSPSAAASLDRAAAMASATLSSTAAAEGASADSLGMPSTLELTEFIDEYVSGTSLSVMTEGSGPSCGVGPSVLGAVTSPDWTHPPGPGVDIDPVLEDPVLGTEVPTGLEGAELDTANSPDLSGIPEVNDPIDPTGQGLSPTPEGTSESLPCGQRVVTPELSNSPNSSFEVISDTDSEKRPDRRTAPAFGALGTLGGKAMADTNRPPLGFDDLYTIVRTTSVANFEEATENLRHTFQTAHSRDVLVALMMAMTTAQVAVATEIRRRPRDVRLILGVDPTP